MDLAALPDLPDFLAEETEQIILQRMINRIPPDIDTSEGSYIYDALAAVAPEITQTKIDMQEFLKRGFARYTYGAYLEHIVYQRTGQKRKEPVKSSGIVKVTGTPGTLISFGSVPCTTADELTGTKSVEYSTLADVEIGLDGVATVGIEAIEAGVSGNVGAGTINQLFIPISGVQSVINEVATSGGADAESDASLLARYLITVQNPGTSGNDSDYLTWAMEVDGVGDAKVIPEYAGAGTVKVVLVDNEKLPANQDIVNAVNERIVSPNDRTKRTAPIGATVTIEAAVADSLNFTANVILTGSKTLADVMAAYRVFLNGYRKEVAFSDDPTIRYGKAAALLFDVPGVQDYSNLLINGVAANVVVAAGHVPIIGTVDLIG